MPTREDDKFLRKIIWFLGGLTLTSAGAIIAMQIQITSVSKAVEEINDLHKTMTDIRIGVAELVANSVERNKIMERQSKKQDAFEKKQLYIFGEQKERKQTIIDARAHIKDWRKHQ